MVYFVSLFSVGDLIKDDAEEHWSKVGMTNTWLAHPYLVVPTLQIKYKSKNTFRLWTDGSNNEENCRNDENAYTGSEHVLAQNSGSRFEFSNLTRTI